MRFIIFLLGVSSLFAQGWTRLTHTAIKASPTDSVCPINNPTGSPTGSTYLDLCYTKIDAWGGAVADTKRGRLVILDQGGHAASPGNESYSLDLVTVSSTAATGCTTGGLGLGGCSTNTAVPTLTRITDPSVWTDCFPSHTPNADGSPWASHQYGSLVYLPVADKYVTWMGGCYSQGYDTRLMLFNPSNKSWSDTGYAGTVNGGDGAYCALDPTQAQESIICLMGSGSATVRDLVRYNTVTNTATTLLTPAIHWQDGPGIVVDPQRGYLYSFGNDFAGTPSTNAKLFVTDLKDPSYTTTDWTSTLVGCSDLLQNGYPGVQWDPTINKVIGYVPRRQITSSTSNTVGTGTKTFTVAAGLTWIASGARIIVEDVAAYGTNEMIGTVTSYSGTTLTLSIASTSGSGTISSWIVNIQYNTIVVFDPAMRTCVVDPNSSGATGPTPSDAMLSLGRGMFGRFSYFPALGKYAVISDWATDAWTFKLNNTPTNGMGSSSVTCVDRDGDGYGMGPGCSGPDADDQDSAVHTSAQALSKWTDIPTFLKHEGYAPENIWYVSPAGNDGTGAVNDATKPFLTCCGGGKANPAAGDALMFRSGTYASFFDTSTIGTIGHPTYLLAYPGETPLFVAGSGTPCIGSTYQIIDGLTYNNSGGTADLGCANTISTEFRHIYAIADEWQIENSHMTDFTLEDSALGDNWPAGCGSAQHAVYLTSHDPMLPSSNVFVRRNLLYKSCYNGIQVNGKFSNVLIEQNIVYSNDVGGIAFLTGVKNSVVRSNLSFNNAQTAFNFFNYPDFCAVYDPTGIGTTCPYAQTGNLIENNTFYNSGSAPKTGDPSTASPSIGVTNSQGYVLSGTSQTIGTGSKTFTLSLWSSGASLVGNDIVIFSDSYYVALDNSINKQPDMNLGTDWNLIGTTSTALWSTNNRIRVCPNLSGGGACGNTTANWMEGLVTAYSGTTLTINFDTVVGSGTFSNWIINLNRIGDLGSNTFRNNILVSYSAGSGGTGFPPFRYDESAYASTSTYQNNLFYNLTPTAGSFTNVIQTVSGSTTTYYTCAQAVSGSGSTFGSFSNCTNANPQFSASSPSFWNAPASFNFNLVGGSPGIAAGSTTFLPPFDQPGTAFSIASPALGGLQGSPPIGSTITGTLTVSGGVTIK